MSKNAHFEPQRVEICSPIIYHKYVNNYQGPLKKSGTVNYQIFATVLENVCYKVYGVIKAYSAPVSYTHLDVYKRQAKKLVINADEIWDTPLLSDRCV